MKKQTAYIFAAFIVVLIILAIVIMWLTGGIGGDKPEATPTPEVETSAPRQTQFVIPTATPQPTEAVPTETPTVTATPAPAPTPEATSGTVIGSGSFEHPYRMDCHRAGRRQRKAHAVGVCALIHDGDRPALDRYKRKRRDLRRYDAIFQRRFPELADRYAHLYLFDDRRKGQQRFRQRRLELQGPVQRPGSRRDLLILNDFLAAIFRGELTHLQIHLSLAARFEGADETGKLSH